MKSNILFIDDDKNVLEGYQRILEKKEKSSSLVDDVFAIDDEESDDFEREVFPFDYQIFTASQGKDGAKIVEDQLESGNPINVAFIDMRELYLGCNEIVFKTKFLERSINFDR